MSATSKATPRPATTGLTPSASSPPRSVPSPAHLQAPNSSTKAGKSPYKHPSAGTPHNASSTPHLPGSTPHAALGTPHATPLPAFGTPTPRFDPMLGSSPATGADMRVSGSELGMGTPALSMSVLGVGMGLSLSSMGLGAQQLGASGILDPGGQQNGEDEAQRRMGAIVQLLGRRWGRVGREGVERCARRLGLECLWENNEGDGHSTLSIAGNGLLVDVEWVGERVRGVVLSFPGAGGGAERSAGVGAEVLRRDLVGHKTGYVGLEAFAANLGSLAGMDVLGREGVSCFEAVEGVRASLGRVWEWELRQARTDIGPAVPEEAVEREVLCKRSGRPRMHGAGAIGLRLEYWLARRRVLPRAPDADDMDIDVDPSAASHPTVPTGLHALLIDCEAHPATLYPSIRVSDAWVSPSVVATPMMSPSISTLFVPSPIIDWLDPPPTYLPTSSSSSSPSPPLASPSVRFRALLRPPLTLPLQKAMELFNIVGAPLTQDAIHTTTFTQLLFPAHAASATETPLLRDAVMRFERRVRGYDGEAVRHHYTLLTGAQDWGRTVSEIPFAHPRQLVMLLPLLRQWAFVGRLLGRLEGRGLVDVHGNGGKVNGTTGRSGDLQQQKPEARGRETDSDTDSDTDTDDGADGERPASKTPPRLPSVPLRRVDVELSLAVPGTPSIRLVIPGGRTVTFHVGLNAEIEVEEEEGGADGAGGKRRKEDWGKVLGVCEDLGVVVEWALEA
ncbi:hypothetical protein MMC26_002085 [Xylographa opegraphella]|nr:hypothetical protein [Xylographa opegraphella]